MSKPFAELEFVNSVGSHSKRLLALFTEPNVELTRYQDFWAFRDNVSADLQSVVLSAGKAGQITVGPLESEGSWVVIGVFRTTESYALAVAAVLAMIEQNGTCLFEDINLGFDKAEVSIEEIYQKYGLNEQSDDFRAQAINAFGLHFGELE